MVNRLNLLEDGLDDEVKRQLAEYLHDFSVTDNALKTLLSTTQRLHADLTQSNRDVIRAIQAQQIVIDRQVIDQIKTAVERSSGLSIRDLITKTQQQQLEIQYREVKQAQTETLKRSQQTMDRLDGVDTQLDQLEERVESGYSDMRLMVLAVGAGAILAMIPLYVMAFDRHPWLTGLLMVVVIGLLIAVVVDKRGDNHD